MAETKKREKTRIRYPNDLKRKIAKEYLSGRASYSILAEENGLRSKSVAREFVRWYKRQLAKDDLFGGNIEQPITDFMAKSKEELEKELVELKQKLKLSTLKNELLETIIDLAEKELNVDIRKKSGTKQLKI